MGTRNSLGRAWAAAVATFALGAVLAGVPAAAKAELQKVIIRFSADLPPPPHPTAIAMNWFKEQVEAQFPKGSEVRNFFAGGLYKDPDAMKAMTQGNLEMGWLITGKTASNDIWLSIIGQPGALTTVAAIHDLENQPTGKMLLARLRDKHNVVPFGFADLSFALHVAGKQRMVSLDSLKGKKIRTFTATINPAVASWGASPVVMAFGEVPSALESGVIDGLVTSIGGWRSVREQAPYYTHMGISTVTFDNYWVGASARWFNRLNRDTQSKISALVAQAIVYQNELNWCNDQLSIEAFKASKPSDPGIYVATPEEVKRLQAAIGNSVADFLKGKLPEDARPWVDRYLADGRAASARLASGTDPLEKLSCTKYEAVLKSK